KRNSHHFLKSIMKMVYRELFSFSSLCCTGLFLKQWMMFSPLDMQKLLSLSVGLYLVLPLETAGLKYPEVGSTLYLLGLPSCIRQWQDYIFFLLINYVITI